MPNKIWFIAGASRGLGCIWAYASIGRGDTVAATARTVASIADLKEKYGANVLTLEPAVIRTDGTVEWYRNGIQLTAAEVEKKLAVIGDGL
jgi:NADP-dependent 3-hydroxy acid dehydrogenase YdfG